MASVTGIINVKVNTAGAVASLAGLGKAMQAQNAAMLKGSAAVGAGQLAAARAMQGRLNQSGKWVATTGSMMTATGRMAEQFDKGTHKSFSNFRRGLRASNMDMAANTAVNRLAQQRVRALQTQYMGLGREVDGVQKVMKMTPASMLTDNFGRSAEYANQRAVLFRRNLTMGANSMVNWGKNTQWAGRQMMVGLGIPLGIAAVGAVRSFKDIEQASISFRRVYGDSVKDTAQANGVLKTVMSDVGQEYTKYGVAMSDTIAVAARAAATGQKGADLVGTTRETLRLATLGQLDYDQALESTIATQTAFGVSTNGLTRVTDFLNAAENQTILSMSDMTKAIPRVAPVIRGLGGDVEDLGVLMTALRAGGVTAEQGANALKSGLASLINPTSSATAAMKDFGIPLDKIVNTNKGDLIGTVQDFGKALQELPKFEQQQALESLFGKYQYARMGALFRNINKKQAQTTADLSRSSNEKLASFSSQEMDQIADSALNKFQGAVERLKAAAAPLGEAVLKVLAPVIDFGASALTFLTDNSWAAWAAGGVAALTGLIGVGTMLTGVFANFFGTMIKGGQMMHRAGAWSRSLLTGKRNLHGGMGLEGYSSIAELEASSAQKALSAAANAASASFMKEAEAVAVLVAELQRMNAAAAQSVATTTAAGKRPPGSGAVGVPAQTPPSTPPSSGGAVGLPALAPPRTAKQGTVSSFQAGHIGGLTTMTPAQIRTMREAQNAPTAKNFNKSAPVPFSPYRKETAWWADEQARKMAADSSYAPKAYTGQNILMSSGLNAELNNQKTQGGFGSAGKGLWLESLRETGAASMTNPLRMMGIRSNNPMAAQYATGLFDSFARQVAAHPGEYIDEKTAGRYLDHAAGQTFANDPKLMAQYEKLKLANAVDTKSIPGVASGGRRGVAEALPGAGLLPSYAGANKTSLVNWGGVGDMPIGAETLGVIDGALGSLAGAAGSATGALEGLAGAAAGAAGKSQAATTAARAAIPDGLTPSQRTQNLAGRMANTTFSDPALEQRRQAVLAQREQRLAAQQAAQQQENRAKSDAARASQYARGYAAQQAELEKSQKAATSAAAKSNSPSLWNRMRAGGVFSGGTRGMTPEEKLAYDEKKQGRMAGMSNKLFGLGMAVDVVTMGLTMTGHELPGFAHVIGPATMALGMFPGAITPLISLLANPVTAGVAAVAAAAGGLVLAYNYAEEQSRDAGIAQGNFAVAGGQALKAMEESTGQESLYTKAMNRKVAQLTDSTSSDVQRASELSQSEYGKQMSQSYADAVKNGDFEAANSSLANQLSTGVLQKVLTIGEARAMSDSLIGGVNGQDVRTQMDSMIGKKGQLLDQNPYDFASQSMRQSQTALKAAMSDVQETAEQGIDWGKVWNELANNDQASNERSALDEILSPNMDNAKAEGAASSIWTNSAQAAYQNKLAAEERIRMAVEARAAAEKKIADLKKADPDGYKQGKEYKDAQKAYDNADRTVTRGRNSRGDYDAGLANLNTLGHNQVKGMTGDPLNQFVATGYDSLEALYSQEPGKLAALNSDRQTLDAQAANLMGRGLLTGDEAQLGQAAYQNFVNTGMAPGGMQDYTQLASQAGLTDEQAFKQMETLWGNGIGGEALSTAQQNFNNPNLKLGKAAEGTMAAQVINAKDAATLDKYNSNLQSLTDLGPKMQAAVKDAYGPENLLGKNPEDIKSVVDWAKKSGNGANNFNPNKFGPAPEVPFEGNRGNQGQGKQGGGYRPGDRSYSTSGDRGGPTSTRPDPNQSTTIPDHSPERNAPFADFFGNAADNMWPDYLGQSPSARADERTSIKAVPESIAKPGYKGPTIIPTGKSAAIKPDLGAATAAGKAEGQARGTAMASTVLQKAKASGQPMQAVAKQAGTQQGKIQGQAIGAGIGSSLGKTKSQAGRALSSIGKAGKQGQIQLKVNDAGATAKINKVKSAMGKLKGGKGGDIKLKATDNASSKIQKVTSKAKQLKNAKTDIKIKASDNASAKLTKVKAKANALKNAKANIPIKAQDNASPKLSEVKSKAANLQGLNVNIPIKATDNASAPANQAKTAITAVGQLAPNPTINANAAPAILGAAMATAAIAAIPSSKTVTINVVKTGAIAGGGLIDSVYLAGGGEPTNRGIFTGRRVSGPGGPTEDKVPAWLSAGEFVMRAAAVKRYGSGFMYNVNAMKFDKGGKVGNDQGGNEEDSKKKGSDDSGGKDDKDTGWKDWTKEVKKLSKSWDKASKLAVKMKVSNPLLASLFGTGSPNAIGKFNPKKSKQIKKQFKKKQLMESLQATFDTLSENEKMAKAAQARVKLLKKHKGLSEDINRLEADELLAIKKSKNSKAVLKKVMKARNAASDAMFAQEWQSFADESTQSQALNAKRVELANSQKNPEYKKLMLQLTDEEVKQYNATKPGKREQFLIRRRKAMLAQEAFEKEVAKEERLSDLRGQKDFSNRFSNKEFQSLAIESPAAAAGMTEEDYKIMQSLSGDELEKFRKALIQAAEAASATSRATEILNKKAEYAAMTLGQQFQEGTDLLNQKSQAMRDEQAAIGEQKIIEATGKTRNQLEAEIGTRGVEVSRFQHQQELEQRHMDDINEKYNEQAKLLDDISQAQQIISSLQRGRLSVANALSSGDIAAAAAAAQEQRASEAQASIDMMKSALEKERDDRLKEHQDRIDEAQDSIDTLNDQIFEYQHAMDSIAATYALIGADTSVNIDKLNTSLQAQSGYWAAVVKDIDEYINALKEINPNVLELPEPSQTTPTTPSAPGGDNNNNNNNNNNNTTPPPLTPKQTKAVKIADRVEKKAMKAMDKAQDAKSAAKKTQTKKDDKKAKKAINKAKKIEGLADKADKVALTGDVGKAKELNQNAKQKLENVNNKVGSVNVVASKADSKVADKKVDNLQDKLKAAKEDDDRKKAKALAAKLEKAKEDAKKAENAKQQAQAAAAAKKKADDDEKARQKKKADDDENRKKQSQEAEKQRKKKEEDNKKAQAQNKNKKNNGGFITKKYAGGGFVGGVGNTDKVPALLTPGEFVMTKGSAARYGKALEKVNSPSYKFASSAAGYSGGSAMGTSIYNLTVNAQTNADANDIATITIKRIQDMERTRIRERKV